MTKGLRGWEFLRDLRTPRLIWDTLKHLRQNPYGTEQDWSPAEASKSSSTSKTSNAVAQVPKMRLHPLLIICNN